MTQCTASGYQGRWAVQGGSSLRTIDANSERWDFNKDGIKKLERVIYGNGITGTRSKQTSRRRRGPYSVGGALEIDPSFAFFDAWLPRILGADESSDTFAVAEELPAWDIMSDRVGNIVRYNDCKVDKARLKFSPDSLVLTLDVLGLAAVETGLSYPAITNVPTTISYTPLAFLDCTFSIASANRNITDGELIIDNAITPHIFAGSSASSCLREGERLVTLTEKNTSASADWSALYGINPTTIAITIAYLNMSAVITLNNCMAPIETPTVDGKQEILMGLTWTAHASGSTKEIVVTNDPVNT